MSRAPMSIRRSSAAFPTAATSAWPPQTGRLRGLGYPRTYTQDHSLSRDSGSPSAVQGGYLHLLQESSSSANSGTTNYIPTSQVNFFDYVIVGGGTAGCVIASRLAGYLPHKKILLIEGGPSDFNDDRVLQLKDWLTLLGGDLDYDYGTTEQPNGNHIFPLQIKHQETELSQEIHTFATPAQKCSAAAPHIIH